MTFRPRHFSPMNYCFVAEPFDATMDRFALAQTMKEMTRRTDACWGSADIIQHQFAGAPFGSAYVCISPGEQGEFASSNPNRLYLCGAEPGLSADGIKGLLKLFGDAGVGRYFVWISPGPQIEVVRCWLADVGLRRRPYVSYLTLARDARQTGPAATGFDVREVDRQEVERLSGRLDGIVGPEYLRSLGAPGVHHFVAFEGEQPVASAVLYAFEELGYLGMALTAEPSRRSERANRPADQEGGGGRMQDRRLGNVVDRKAFTGQPAKGRFRGGLREGGVWPVRGQ
jgi:hypothetical protein